MRKFFLFVLFLSSFSTMNMIFAANDKIDIVVVGFTEHGPLQPTIKAIKDVVSKYGDKIKLTIISSSTDEGSKYMKKHKLDAHLNVVINGKYKYNVNGKKIVFQWFEGKQWTKKDLEDVINNILNPDKEKK